MSKVFFYSINYNIVIQFLLLILNFYRIVSTNPAKPEDYESKVELETTALEMSRVYQENKLKGDATYKGKWVKVTGTVADIGK